MTSQLPRVLSRAEALERGFTHRMIERRIATGRWTRILPRTYLTVDTATERDHYRAALRFAGRGAALSGAAALRTGGFERIGRPASVLVLVPMSRRIESHDWVAVRRTPRPIRTALWPGPRHVEPARAAADHALTLARLDDVRALVAMVVRDGRCTLDELALELSEGPRQGSAHLRQAVGEVCAGAASAPEARAAHVLRRSRGIPPFEQNVPIRLSNGRVYIADFYWRALRAVLEIDSMEYHLGPTLWRATMDRHLELTTAGLAVVHRPPSALADENRFADEIGAWLAARARELAVAV